MIPSVENSRCISILNQSEINELYEIPKFIDDERGWYFELHNSELELLKLSGSRKTKVDAILQLGYFKAKNQFFGTSKDIGDFRINFVTDDNGKINYFNLQFARQFVFLSAPFAKIK